MEAIQKRSYVPIYKTEKLSTEIKGDNSYYRKFGRAITIWEAIQKRIYKADAKNELRLVQGNNFCYHII